MVYSYLTCSASTQTLLEVLLLLSPAGRGRGATDREATEWEATEREATEREATERGRPQSVRARSGRCHKAGGHGAVLRAQTAGGVAEGGLKGAEGGRRKERHK